ncbi:hypothetical protein SDC9_171200 [bioreactor metagenome]|uniref:HTH marR-type domain-containing protein n=1 Tax=bioreactor metagenome TaxID=1076179 RepID=A0A645GA66_9ZZZZ|nr:MarR family transcriptional regulator [Candidatus Pelethousia sp.]
MKEEAYIFGTIFTLSNKLQLLGDKIDAKLTVKQWFLLAGVLHCDMDAPTLSEVAARIGSSRQNIKKMALILERQGFVLMEKDAFDARMLRIRLTDACKAHLKQREQVELRFMQELFSNFAVKDLLPLCGGLKKLESNVKMMEQIYDGEKRA